MILRSRANRIALLYALFGGLYIVGSDYVLHLLADHHDAIAAEIAKGLGFILVTTALLYLVARGLLGLASREREKAEATAQSRQELIEALPNIYFELDERGRLQAWNTRGVEITGLAGKDLAGGDGLDVMEPADREAVRVALQQLYSNGGAQAVEARLIGALGQRIPYLWHSAPRLGADGTVVGVLGIGVDISRLRHAEETARAEEAKFRLLFAQNPIPMMLYSRNTLRFIEVNDAALRLYGYSRKEIMALSALEIRPEEDQSRTLEAIRRMDSGSRISGEWRHMARDGRIIDVAVNSVLTTFEGEPVILATVRDLTLEKSLQARLEQAIEAMSEGFVMVDAEDRLVMSNRRYREMFAPIADLIVPGARYADWVRATAERGLVDLGGMTVDDYVRERMRVHREGVATTLQFGDRIYAFRDRSIPGGGFVGVRTDITEVKAAEEELFRRNEMLHAAGRLANLGYWRYDAESGMFEASEEIHDMRGASPGGPLSCDDVARSTHPDDRDLQRAMFDRTRLEGLPLQMTARMLTTQGSERRVWIEGQAEFDAEGNITGVIGIVQDVTERLETEAKLEHYERTLAHAQKMDALGQLTGGVAHDFNNLLLVVLGNLDMLRERVAAEKDLIANVDIALKAARRGADLTQRLLAYSRQQNLRPTGFDLNEAIREIDPLLRSTLGATIEIRLALAREAPRIFADRSQLETALLNLALNARDAMAEGGHLLIETDTTELDDAFVIRHGQRDAPVGPYARLKITDTGTGIDPAHLDHVFEPFFTTKGVGEGTGLGLSMVYGFMTQSNGFVDIHSRPGVGTTLMLYFPLSDFIAVAEPQDESGPPSPEARPLAILLVEDEPDIRKMIRRYLEGHGCHVVAAGDGMEALGTLESGERFDILLTDVVLPRGTGGRELARLGKQLQPDLGIVFMSGYPALRDESEWLSPADVTFLEKPFKLSALWDALQDRARPRDCKTAESD